MPWTRTHALHVPAWSRSPTFVPCGGSCWEEGLPPWLREAREGGGGSRLLILGLDRTCLRALKATALQGGFSVLSCCYSTWKSSSARSHSLSLQRPEDEHKMAKLPCFPLPQSNGSTSLHHLPAACLMWLTLSPAGCQIHMPWSVRQLLSLPRGLCSISPTWCTSASSSPRAPARNIASEEATAGEWHTSPHQHGSQRSPPCLWTPAGLHLT